MTMTRWNLLQQIFHLRLRRQVFRHQVLVAEEDLVGLLFPSVVEGPGDTTTG